MYFFSPTKLEKRREEKVHSGGLIPVLGRAGERV
jgi:hypothetical protein